MSVGFSSTSIDIIELPQHIPAGMPYAVDDCSVAFHLGFRNRVMWKVLIDTTKMYTVHKIPKKNGGTRVVHAPESMMKLLLQRLHVKFLVPMHKKLGPHVTAYREELSVVDAVAQHIPECPICAKYPKEFTPKKHTCPRRGLFIKMDLKDFFHTHTRAWIRNYFKSIGYSHTVAGILAGLMVVPDVPNLAYQEGNNEQRMFTRAPQGSPASGAICNLIADQRLDGLILDYLKSLDEKYSLEGEWRWRYTRYSDDLSITCGINFPTEERKEITDRLKDLIRQAGYRVNGKKTRISHSYHHRALLGIVFNTKLNYAQEEYMKLRAITHNCAAQGFESQYKRAKQESVEAMITWLRGSVNWVKQINVEKGQRLLDELNVAIAMHEGGTNVATF